MSRVNIDTTDAPSVIGAYSQAVVAQGMVFTAGQIGLDPVTGELAGDDIEAQTSRVLDNLEAVLAAAGSSFDDVMKTTIYMTDIGDFGKVNIIYSGRMGESPPARSTVEVSALPLGALIEMDMVAIVSSG